MGTATVSNYRTLREARTTTPGPSSSMSDPRRSGTYEKLAVANLNVTPKKSISKLDFFRSSRSAPSQTEDKGKRRAVTPEPTAENSSVAVTALHSPQARAPVSFVSVPKLQKTPPTPQKSLGKDEQTSRRVDSFMSDSLPIVQPLDSTRLTPPPADHTAHSRHPAFASSNTPNTVQPQAIPMQRSKSAPGSSRGRTSPCLRIPSPKFFNRDKDKDVKKERKVTPESVSSPILREKHGHLEKRPSLPHQKIRRTTHGSFDFERPGSRSSSKSGQSETRSTKSDEENERHQDTHTTKGLSNKIVTAPVEVSKSKHKTGSPPPPLPSPPIASRFSARKSPTPARTRSPPAGNGRQNTSHDDDSTLPRLSSSMGRSSRLQRTYAGHPSFSFEPASSLNGRARHTMGTDVSRTVSGAKSLSVRHSDQIVDTHTGLMWAPTKLSKNGTIEEVGGIHSASRSPRFYDIEEEVETKSVEEATEVLVAMRSVLSDVGFATLQKCEGK